MPGTAKVAKKQTKVAIKKRAFTKGLEPGTISIILAGRYRGKRAVVLKQFRKSGVAIISGPFRVNGVPLRRIDPRYMIKTSTKVDLSKMNDVIKTIKPSVFKRAQKAKRVKGEKDFMGDKKKKNAEKRSKKTSSAVRSRGANAGKVSKERYQMQKAVDSGIIGALKADKRGAELRGYLKSVFTLKPGDCPHRLNW